MFTGIIENIGTIKSVKLNESNRTFWVESAISHELKIDQSVSHDGVCLTIEEISSGKHRITAIQETLEKTAINNWKEGSEVNLERCLQMNGRLDGHLVQGHIDSTAVCINKKDIGGSLQFEFEISKEFKHLVIEKGSVCLNGISLTGFNVSENTFSVAVIPYTFANTNLRNIEKGDEVNIEYDIIGKYLFRFAQVFETAK